VVYGSVPTWSAEAVRGALSAFYTGTIARRGGARSTACRDALACEAPDGRRPIVLLTLPPVARAHRAVVAPV